MYMCNLESKNNDELIIPNVRRIFDYDSRIMTARNLLSKGTQTDYRDSETQTVPWEPPYKLATGSKPEVLDLENLSWGKGLPVGMEELKIINKMRVKKSWESLLPPLDCKVNVQTHKAIITMIDREEWTFHDKELQSVMDARQELVNQVIETNNYEQKKKLIKRFEKVGKYLNKMRSKQINKINRELNREMRKISAKYCNKNSKFIKNYLGKTTDLKDEFILRLKLDDEFFYDSLLSRKTLDKKDPTSYLSRVNHINQIDGKKSDELCVRETRLTDEMLKNLYVDLKNIRLNTTSKKTR